MRPLEDQRVESEQLGGVILFVPPRRSAPLPASPCRASRAAAEHGKALSEMRRVTRPRGVVSACVWDYDDGMQMLRFFWDEVVALDPAAAPRDERHMKLSREGQLGQLWRREGLAEVQERPITIRQTFASFADYWEPFSVAGTDRLRLRRKNALRPVPARALDTRASTLRKPGAGPAGRVPGAR